MELCLTETQLRNLIKNTLKTKELGEQETPVNPEPKSGTSDKQTGGSGYPEVNKWESGVTRGPANQVGVTKWSDVVGANLKRSKANQLKEQIPDSRFGLERWGYDPNKPETLDVAINKERQYRKDINPHDVLSVLELATVFIPVVGPLVSAGFGLGNAALYYKDGDTKTAGLFTLFSLLPFVGELPMVKKLGQAGMDALVKKLSTKGSKVTLTPLEKNVVNEISKNKNMLKTTLNDKIKKMASNAVNKTKNLSPTTKKNLLTVGKFGLASGAYLGAGVAYSKTYDYFDKKNQEKKMEDIFNRLSKTRTIKDTTDLTPLDIELANRN